MNDLTIWSSLRSFVPNDQPAAIRRTVAEFLCVGHTCIPDDDGIPAGSPQQAFVDLRFQLIRIHYSSRNRDVTEVDDGPLKVTDAGDFHPQCRAAFLDHGFREIRIGVIAASRVDGFDRGLRPSGAAAAAAASRAALAVQHDGPIQVVDHGNGDWSFAAEGTPVPGLKCPRLHLSVCYHERYF